jgi:hypothetical protein
MADEGLSCQRSEGDATMNALKQKLDVSINRLDESEQQLQDAMLDHSKAFLRQAEILQRIYSEGQYRDAGYDTFKTYINDRHSLGIRYEHATRLMNALAVSKMLPEIEIAPGQLAVWTEKAIRPLTHKEFTPADQKRIGKKIATQVKNGEAFSANLVKRICDDDRGVDRQKAEKQREDFNMTPGAQEVIEKLDIEIEVRTKSLAGMPDDFWIDTNLDSIEKTIRKLTELIQSRMLEKKWTFHQIENAQA